MKSWTFCISCKGCTSECPSNVDMSTLKAEFLHQYYQSNGIPLRAKVFANIAKLNQLASTFPTISNFFINGKGAFLLKKYWELLHTEAYLLCTKQPYENGIKKITKHLLIP